jgi:Uma2 family endonuclease
MTADELLDRSSGLSRCELIRGELKMMSPAGGNHGDAAYELGFRIGQFVRENRLGKMYTAETGFVLERNPDTVRAPDVAFIAADRVKEAKTPKYIPIPPDLVVEVNSPNDRAGEVVQKAGWWLSHGVREVWVCDPPTETITLYPSQGTPRVWQSQEILNDSAVLPGFTLELASLFAE